MDVAQKGIRIEREDILACHEFARRMLAAKTIHLPIA
jgi:hypothetical protein